MKLAKLSLATIVVAGLCASVSAADTLEGAFKAGKLSGELRMWYFDRDRSTSATSAEIINTGLVLNYVTGSFYGFSIGATMQSSYSPFANESAKRVFNSDMWGPGAQLSEAYVNYKIGNTVAKVGRQYISTPLVGRSASRMITTSFEAAMVTNTDLPQTTLTAGVITKHSSRTDGDGGVGKFSSLNNDHDPAYTLLIVNRSMPNTRVTAQYLTHDNDSKGTNNNNRNAGYDNYYLEMDYRGKGELFNYGIGLNYLYTDWKSWDAAYMYGVKLTAGYEDFSAYIAYSSISDDANNKGVKSGVGGGAQPNFVKGYQWKVGTYTSDTTGYSVDLNYRFRDLGLRLGTRYTNLDVKSSAATPERSYLDLYADYKFKGLLKGLELDVRYMTMGKDEEGKELWMKAAYKF